MIAFFYNIFRIGWNLPAVLALIRVMFDFIGSDQTQLFLEKITAAIKETFGQKPVIDGSEPAPVIERRRLWKWDRAKRLAALDELGMTEIGYVDYCAARNVSGEIQEC